MSEVLRLTARYYRTYPAERPLGHAEELLELETARTAFVLVDVYGRGYDPDDQGPGSDSTATSAINDDRSLYEEQVRANRSIILNHIVPAKAAAKALGLEIIYISNYLSAWLREDSEWRKLSLRVHNIDVLKAWSRDDRLSADVRSTSGTEKPPSSGPLAFSDVMRPLPGEHFVQKQMYSGFFETRLHALLNSLGTTNLVVVGFDSNICLAHTVVDAMYRDYRVVVLRDAVATSPRANGLNQGTGEARWLAERSIRFIETNVGYTTTTDQWAASCQGALPEPQAP